MSMTELERSSWNYVYALSEYVESLSSKFDRMGSGDPEMVQRVSDEGEVLERAVMDEGFTRLVAVAYRRGIAEWISREIRAVAGLEAPESD
jgi:hypothetical protein